MASTNQSPQYQKAEAMFLAAKTEEDRLYWLDEMIRECPKHKSAEKMLAQLRTRRKKLLEKIETGKKKGKSTKHGIKKEEMQAVIVGFTNTGKSSLISLLTKVTPAIAPYNFTTKQPVVGMINFHSAQIQIIEVPAFGSEFYNRGLVNSADVILILVTDGDQIKKIEDGLHKTNGEKILVFNVKEEEGLNLRKIEATLKSRKYNFVIISTQSGEGIEELKEKIFHGCKKIRVFTKEPRKQKSENPLILEREASVKLVAEKIFKDISKIKETKIWGPSSKFPGQIVGFNHELKDLDVVEFKTR